MRLEIRFWVPTVPMGAALALLSVGVGLDALAITLDTGLRKATAVVLVLDSVACSVQAWLGWVHTERALRERRALPAPGLALWLAVTVSTAAILLLVAVVLT